jgi:hypothetical protein
LTADHALQRDDLGFLFLDQIGGTGIVIEGAGLVSLNPDANELARDVMSLGESMQRLPGNELLGNLALELDAVGTVLGHGLHPSKARSTLLNYRSSLVRPQGRTPIGGQFCKPIDTQSPSATKYSGK